VPREGEGHLKLIETAAAGLSGEGWDANLMRRRIDAADIRDSVAETGVVQPVTLGQWRGGFRVIAGFRRVKAALDAGLAEIGAVVYAEGALSPKEAFRLALASNAPGLSLGDADKALSLAKARGFGFTDKELKADVAVMLGLAASYKVVRQYLQVAALPAPVLDALCDGAISRQHAQALCALGADERGWFFEAVLRPLRLSAGDTRFAVAAAIDLASREGTSPRRAIESVLDGLDLSAAPAATRRDFKARLARRLSPVIMSMEDEFAALREKLGPGPFKLEHAGGFEADELTLTARIESAADAEALRSMLERGIDEGLFEWMLSVARRRTEEIEDSLGGEKNA